MRAEKGLRGLLAILQPIAWLILRGFGEHPQYVAALLGDGQLQHARRALRAHAPGGDRSAAFLRQGDVLPAIAQKIPGASKRLRAVHRLGAQPTRRAAADHIAEGAVVNQRGIVDILGYALQRARGSVRILHVAVKLRDGRAARLHLSIGALQRLLQLRAGVG